MVIVALIVALVVVADHRTKDEVLLNKLKKQNGDLQQQIKKLRDDNEKLKIERAKSEADKKLAISIKPTGSGSVQRVRSAIFDGEKAAIADKIRATFGTEVAVRVAVCESGLNPYAVGSHGERGLFQIHPVHIPSIQKAGFSWDQMFDPGINITYAKMLYEWQGWSPWICAKMI